MAIDDSSAIYANHAKVIDVLGNDVNATAGSLTITHLNGVAVVAGQTVVLASGDSVTLNADGTLTVLTDADADTLNFTYEVSSTTGETDVGIVTINTIPCFVAGTRIATPDGEVPVEALKPGDLVLTHDDGPQPLRWVGRRTVAAQGSFAPIRIQAGTFGDHGALLVSPQHRVLIGDSTAELLFGEAEVLVAAKDLVDGQSVHVVEGGMVEYVHLLFDRHQVIYSAGLTTESFLPGPQTTQSFEREIVDEICAIFAELDPETGEGYSPAARQMLKGYEARVWMAKGLAV